MTIRNIIGVAVGAFLFFYLVWKAPLIPIGLSALAFLGGATWLANRWGIHVRSVQIVATILIAITLGAQGARWWVERYPPAGEAAGRSTNYAALTMADIMDPRYPTRLSMFLTDAKRLRINIEEQRCINQLSEAMENMAALQPHQPFRQDDDSVIAACSRRFERLRKQLADTQYTESIAGRIAEKTLSTKFLAFGALLGLLAIGLAIPKGTRKTAGWIGGIASLSILIGGAILFFGADIARATSGLGNDRGSGRSDAPLPLPFNPKETMVQAGAANCTEVWMRGNEEEGVPVGTLASGQTARVRYLDGRIVYNNSGEAWPHWGADYYLPQWKTSLRFHDREGVMPHAILGVVGELNAPAVVTSFKRNANEFTILNSEPAALPLLLYYHDGLQLYAQNGWEGSRAKLEVCILSTTARLNGTP